jgi:hypothetical protein
LKKYSIIKFKRGPTSQNLHASFLEVGPLKNFMNKIFNILTGWKALGIYAIISLFVFILNSPFCQIKLNHFLADLTQQAIIDQINPIRTDQGFLGLKANSKLAKAAQMKAEDMIARGYFSHVGPNGEEPWSWFEKAGYDYASAGENLAVNYFNPNVLIEAWLNSPAHAKNILNSYFTDVGIGIAKGNIPDKGDSTIVVMFLGKEITPAIRLASSQGAVISEEPVEDIRIVAPEKPVVKKIVSDIALGGEAQVKPANTDNIQRIERDYSKINNTKIAVANISAYEIRLIITIFFMILIAWFSATMIVHKEKFLPIRVLRPVLLVFFIIIIWLPDLI